MPVDDTFAAILREAVASSRSRVAKAGMAHSLPDGHVAVLYGRQPRRFRGMPAHLQHLRLETLHLVESDRFRRLPHFVERIVHRGTGHAPE